MPAGCCSGEPGGEGQPARGLDEGSPRLEVAVGPDLAEAGVGHVDDVLSDRPQHLVGEAEPFHHARCEVLRDDVGDGDQLAQELLAGLGPEVQRDAELLDVVVVERAAEVSATTLVDERWHPAEDVPVALA